MNSNSNSFIRVQAPVQKNYFFGFKFEYGKMIEFFRVRVQVQVRSPDTLISHASKVIPRILTKKIERKVEDFLGKDQGRHTAQNCVDSQKCCLRNLRRSSAYAIERFQTQLVYTVRQIALRSSQRYFKFEKKRRKSMSASAFSPKQGVHSFLKFIITTYNNLIRNRNVIAKAARSCIGWICWLAAQCTCSTKLFKNSTGFSM